MLLPQLQMKYPAWVLTSHHAPQRPLIAKTFSKQLFPYILMKGDSFSIFPPITCHSVITAHKGSNILSTKVFELVAILRMYGMEIQFLLHPAVYKNNSHLHKPDLESPVPPVSHLLPVFWGRNIPAVQHHKRILKIPFRFPSPPYFHRCSI